MGNDTYRLVVEREGGEIVFILYCQTGTELKVADAVVASGYHMPHLQYTEFLAADGEWRKFSV